jgi:hypothetical protein
MDASVATRARQKARRKRWRRRQREGTFVVNVEVSTRFLVYLAATRQLSEAELAADDRGAVGRAIARLAEAEVSRWESANGLISTE